MEGGRAEVPTYLGWSIFNALCCCLPLGIVAIIYSSQAKNANAAGQQSTAMEASKKAKMFNIIGLVCGMIFMLIVIILAATRG